MKTDLFAQSCLQRWEEEEEEGGGLLGLGLDATKLEELPLSPL